MWIAWLALTGGGHARLVLGVGSATLETLGLAGSLASLYRSSMRQARIDAKQQRRQIKN